MTPSKVQFYLTIEIPGLPQMANGSQGRTWKRGHFAKKAWTNRVAKELCGYGPARPFHKIRATFTRCSASKPDGDNLQYGFKAIRDALVKFGFVVDDADEHLHAEYAWEKAKAGEGKIRVEIEALDP